MPGPPANPEELVSKLLELIRYHYPDADEATYFLEEEAGLSNIHGIANLRDAMSHVAAFLRRDSTDIEGRVAHFVKAEEHIRRAIFEPYETGIEHYHLKIMNSYAIYKQHVLPSRETYAGFRAAPSATEIQARLDRIRRLVSKGRSSKTAEIFHDDFRTGKDAFVEAFIIQKSLLQEIEQYCHIVNGRRHTRIQVILAVWSLLATIGCGILGILLAK